MTNREKALKEKLNKVKEAGYKLEKEESYIALTMEMIESIGTIDSELRDDLIYEALCVWIEKGKFDYDQLKTLLNITIDNLKFINVKNEDEVFKRTFSVLIIAEIIKEHIRNEFLTEETLYEVKDKLIGYMINEKDVRGYVEDKGWAHSAAHTADALAELVKLRCFNSSDLLEILEAIRGKVCIEYFVYIHEECERMTTVVEKVIDRKVLSNSEIEEWINKFTFVDSKINYAQSLNLRANKKQFLRSLCFRIMDNKELGSVIETIKIVHKAL